VLLWLEPYFYTFYLWLLFVFFAQASLDRNPLIFPTVVGMTGMSLHPAFFCWDISPQMAWNCNPSNLTLLCRWDDRHVQLPPAIGWDGISPTFCLSWS
jgi:hypothetical protein